MNTMLIELTNENAKGLLHELENLKIIRVINENIPVPSKSKLSEKYRGIISEEDGQDLKKHVEKMRGNDVLKKITKPHRKKLDIEVLKKEQNFTQFDRTKFDELVKELDIQEIIEKV